MTRSKRAWTQITPDANGTPRFVIQHEALLTEREKATPPSLGSTYPKAITRAMRLGGRKYSQLGYPRGIVFTTKDLQAVEMAIMEAIIDDTIGETPPATPAAPEVIQEAQEEANTDRVGELLDIIKEAQEELRNILGW